MFQRNSAERIAHTIMIKVTLGDVFHNHERGESWLVLADETGKNGLPIFIGSWDVKFITLGLRKGNPRPLTFNFFANVLEAIGAELAKVQIVGLVNNTFTAVACVRSGGLETRVDARPSDAVALAAVMGRPIYVSEEVMAAAGSRLGATGRPPDVDEGFVSTRLFWSEGPQAGASQPDREA